MSKQSSNQNIQFPQQNLKKRLRMIRQSQPLMQSNFPNQLQMSKTNLLFKKQEKNKLINITAISLHNSHSNSPTNYSPKTSFDNNTTVSKQSEILQLKKKLNENITSSNYRKQQCDKISPKKQLQQNKILSELSAIQQMLAKNLLGNDTNTSNNFHQNNSSEEKPRKRQIRYSQPLQQFQTVKCQTDNIMQKLQNLNTSFQKSKIKLNDFRIIKEIGRGKFGLVSLVMHKKTGFICALKAIKKKLIIQQKIISNIIRQVKIQHFVNNCHIVKLYTVFDDIQNVYLLIEYCPDGQLFKYLQLKKKFQQSQASQIVRDICQGIAALHKHSIIHRDIKPQNVVMCYGMSKICDFGWSVASNNELRQTFCGTPLYVSPQLLQGNSYDEKVDLWAIGIVAFQLLVGTIPFQIKSERQLCKIINSDIDYPTFLSSQAINFIKTLLQKNPQSRQSTLNTLDHEFLTKHNTKNLSQFKQENKKNN